MGLDMYLERETFIGEYMGESRANLKIECPHVNPANVEKIIEEAACWRKANQIHRWFVENVQDGVDECERTGVARIKLSELRALCKKALKEMDAELLPPQEGFFFGDTGIDSWYWGQLENTIKMLDDVLKIPKEEDKASYYYRSSW